MQSCIIRIPQDGGKGAHVFEDFFAQLHESLRGELTAFEICATAQNISLCFSGSSAACEIVRGHVYAIAPGSEVVDGPDFTLDAGKDCSAIAVELGLERCDLFPLKEHGEFRNDSLSGLISVLSRCQPGERAMIQLVARPVADSGGHQFALQIRRKFEKIRHLFRVKYWFKRSAGVLAIERLAAKSKERLFEVNLRAAVFSDHRETQLDKRIEAIYGALSNFNTLDFNQLKTRRLLRGAAGLSAFQKRTLRAPFRLTVKELAGLYHLPGEKEAPNLTHVLSVKQAPPQDLPTRQNDPEICFFGTTNFRDQTACFGIKRADRRRHLYVCGKSGSGKSKLLELLIKNDIEHGDGVGVLDPHGDLVDAVLRMVPRERVKDVIIFDPSDLQYPPSFNPLEQVPEALKMRVTIGFVEIFKKLFGTNWSPRLEHVLRYTTLALLDSPGTTVLSILKMLTDKNYRQTVVTGIKDNVVKNFWVTEFAAWSEKFDNEAITPLINKVGQFVATNMIRNIVGQPVNRFDFRRIMDERKILLMKVSKGILGEENASLLGAIAVTKIYQAAMSRADINERERRDFYLYVDEFQDFATDTFGEILSEARKYRLNLTIANQFLGQLEKRMLARVFGNVGSILTFRVGAEDAGVLAEEFKPRFGERDIVNLGVRDFCLKMTIDGEVREAFSARTLDVAEPSEHFASQCVAYSRQAYARPLKEVEDILQRWEEGREAAGSGAGAAGVEFEEPML